MRTPARLLAAGMLIGLAAGCTPDATEGAAGSPAAGPLADPATGAATPPAPGLAAGCPVTRPSGRTPPVVALTNLGNPISTGEPRWIGNDAVWVNLPADGVLHAVRTGPDTGPFRTKLAWFRAKAGQVEVRARPLTGAPAGFHADVGTVAEYGAVGFAASVLSFERPGCWRLTAALAGSTLAFTVAVAPPDA
jgi:hypothetical protein